MTITEAKSAELPPWHKNLSIYRTFKIFIVRFVAVSLREPQFIGYFYDFLEVN